LIQQKGLGDAVAGLAHEKVGEVTKCRLFTELADGKLSLNHYFSFMAGMYRAIYCLTESRRKFTDSVDPDETELRPLLKVCLFQEHGRRTLWQEMMRAYDVQPDRVIWRLGNLQKPTSVEIFITALDKAAGAPHWPFPTYFACQLVIDQMLVELASSVGYVAVEATEHLNIGLRSRAWWASYARGIGAGEVEDEIAAMQKLLNEWNFSADDRAFVYSQVLLIAVAFTAVLTTDFPAEITENAWIENPV